MKLLRSLLEGGNYNTADGPQNNWGMGFDDEEMPEYDEGDLDEFGDVALMPRGDRSISDMEEMGELEDYANPMDVQQLRFADSAMADRAVELIQQWGVKARIIGAEQPGASEYPTSSRSGITDQYRVVFDGDSHMKKEIVQAMQDEAY